MPVSFSLSTPDGKREFVDVRVASQADIKNPISGQPTSLSRASFTANRNQLNIRQGGVRSVSETEPDLAGQCSGHSHN